MHTVWYPMQGGKFNFIYLHENILKLSAYLNTHTHTHTHTHSWLLMDQGRGGWVEGNLLN